MKTNTPARRASTSSIPKSPVDRPRAHAFESAEDSVANDDARPWGIQLTFGFLPSVAVERLTVSIHGIWKYSKRHAFLLIVP